MNAWLTWGGKHQVTSTQKLASDAQIEKMEKELAKMRAGLSESVQLMEQREMNTNIEYVPFLTEWIFLLLPAFLSPFQCPTFLSTLR